MILSEPRYAAQLVGPGNRTRYYDDIGCALAHMNADPQLKKGKLYVRPFGGDVWVEASKARYVDKQLTPMNSGVGAVAEGGTLDFEAVERLVAEGLHEHR
jgi:copper chaperone NosL